MNQVENLASPFTYMASSVCRGLLKVLSRVLALTMTAINPSKTERFMVPSPLLTKKSHPFPSSWLMGASVETMVNVDSNLLELGREGRCPDANDPREHHSVCCVALVMGHSPGS